MKSLIRGSKSAEGWGWGHFRVIQIWPKWQNWCFATFSARFRIFWKMMFWKMAIFFHFDHSYACHQRPKVLVHNAPMWRQAKNKNKLFSIFSIQNMNWFFKFWIYIKNVFFWGMLCWCSSQNEQMGGGPKWPFLQN